MKRPPILDPPNIMRQKLPMPRHQMVHKITPSRRTIQNWPADTPRSLGIGAEGAHVCIVPDFDEGSQGVGDGLLLDLFRRWRGGSGRHRALRGWFSPRPVGCTLRPFPFRYIYMDWLSVIAEAAGDRPETVSQYLDPRKRTLLLSCFELQVKGFGYKNAAAGLSCYVKFLMSPTNSLGSPPVQSPPRYASPHAHTFSLTPSLDRT